MLISCSCFECGGPLWHPSPRVSSLFRPVKQRKGTISSRVGKILVLLVPFCWTWATQPNRLMGVLPAGEWQAVVHLWSRSVSDGKRIQKCVLYPLNSTSLHSTKWPMSRKSFGKSIVQDGCQSVMYLTFKRPIINLLSRDVLFRELLQNGFLYIQETPGTRVSFLNP